MTSGTAASTDTGLNSALSNLQNNGTVKPVAVPTGDTAAQRYNVNMPVTNPAGSLAFLLLGSDYIVDLELSAAQAEGRGERDDEQPPRFTHQCGEARRQPPAGRHRGLNPDFFTV
jgi:hypothetical protein